MKVGNARACASHPQVRKCWRRAGGIAMRCVAEFLDTGISFSRNDPIEYGTSTFIIRS